MKPRLFLRVLYVAEQTLQGVKAVNIMAKRQDKKLGRSDVIWQAKLIQGLFEVAAQKKAP